MPWLIVTLPTGASFDANSGQFSWTPTFEQSGDYVIEFETTDGQSASTNETVLVKVENTDRAPTINSPGNQSVKEGESLSFKITATDPDKEDQGNLQFSADNLPAGAQFNPDGDFSWTPGADQQGSYDITFKVKDSGDMSDSATISVQVEDVIQTPPVPQEPETPEEGQGGK